MPNIFKPVINKKINNNKSSYYSYLETNLDIDNNSNIKNKDEDPISTLNRLIKSGSYIFNKNVDIITNDKTYHTKIAGKINDRVVTIDGDDIPISSIKKIYEK